MAMSTYLSIEQSEIHKIMFIYYCYWSKVKQIYRVAINFYPHFKQFAFASSMKGFRHIFGFEKIGDLRRLEPKLIYLLVLLLQGGS